MLLFAVHIILIAIILPCKTSKFLRVLFILRIVLISDLEVL